MLKKNLSRAFRGVALMLVFNTMAAEQMLEVNVATSRGTGDDPMIVIWAENDTGDFVRTIHVFSKDKKYHKDLLAWRFKSKNKETSKDVDAVCGATIAWKRSKTIRIPVSADGINLLDGTHVLRVESRQWKGNHYRSMKIPLPKKYKGGIHTDKGYVKSVTISLVEKKDGE